VVGTAAVLVLPGREDAAVVGAVVVLVVGLLLPELQPARVTKTISAPAAVRPRLFTAVTVHVATRDDNPMLSCAYESVLG